MSILTERRVATHGCALAPAESTPTDDVPPRLRDHLHRNGSRGPRAKKLGVFQPGGTVAEQLGWLWPLLIVAWLVAIAMAGGYRASVFGAGPDEYKRVAGLPATAGSLGVGCYLVEVPLSRGFFLLAFAVGPALMGGRFLLRRAVHKARTHGSRLNRVLIAGPPRTSTRSPVSSAARPGSATTCSAPSLPRRLHRRPAGIPVLGDRGR